MAPEPKTAALARMSAIRLWIFFFMFGSSKRSPGTSILRARGLNVNLDD
jgi:hypothetical protein